MPKGKKEITVKIPYIAEGSKNRKFAYRSAKKLSEGYKTFVDLVIILVQAECRKQKVVFEDRQKVFIKLTHYRSKKQTRTDTQNFLESICDGIKVAIQVDDTYFSGSWDWFLSKDTEFIVTISQ